MTELERLLRIAGRRPEPTEEGRARARAAVHMAWTEARTERQARRRWLIFGPALAAATIVLAVTQPWQLLRTPVVFGTITHGIPQGRPGGPGTAVTVGTTLVTDTDTVALGLQAGGRLLVNVATSVQLAGARQLVLEQGHIYVDSGDGQSPDVVVRTPAGEIRDIGTRFDVRVSGDAVEVRVRDGAVRLTDARGSVEARRGQGITANRTQPASVTAVPTYGADWAWVLHTVPFDTNGARLSEFLRWVDAEGGLVVEFPDPALRARVGSTVLHGSIRGLSLDEALAVILPVSGLSYEMSNGRLVLRARGAQ